MFKKLKIIFFLALSVFISNACAQENIEPIQMNLTHFLPRTSVVHSKFIKPWAEKIEKETNGKLKIKIYPQMSLGGVPSDLVEQVRSGAVDAAWTVVSYTPELFPKSEVFELPFISPTKKSTILNQAINEYYAIYLKDEFKDFYVVLLHAHAPSSLHLNKIKPKTLQELNGLKIRIPNRVMSKFITDIGAVPVSMPITDVYESLTYGMINGAMMPFEVAVPLRLHEQTDYHIIAPFYTTVFAFLINKDFYNKLPTDIKDVIEKNSKSHIAYGVGEIWDRYEEEMMLKVKVEGGEFYNLSQEEIDKATIIADKISEEWKNKNGQEHFEKAKELLTKYMNMQKD